MLRKEAFLRVNKKIIGSMLTLCLICYSTIGLFPMSYGASSRVNYTSLDENKYPGYNKLINNLKGVTCLTDFQH